MIRSTTPTTDSRSDVSIREYLAGVKWTGNVRPVDRATEKAVLDAHQESARVGHRGKPRRGRAQKLPRIDAEEIREPSNRVLRILQCISNKMLAKEIAAMEGVRKEAIPHVLRVLSIRAENVRRLHDKSRNGILTYLVEMGRVDQC